MAKRIFLAGSLFIVLVFFLIALIEVSGTRPTLTAAANDFKETLDDKLRGTASWRQGDDDSDDLSDSDPKVTTPQENAFCRWEFSHYESSAYEEEWFKGVNKAQTQICETIAQPHHADASRTIMRRIKGLVEIDKTIVWRKPDSMLPTEAHEGDTYMSRMHYRRTCYDEQSRTFRPATGAGVQLIEPLWGMLRDPFDMFCGDLRLTMPEWWDAQGQSKQHIMPQGFAPYWYDLEARDASHADGDPWRSHGLPPWHSGYGVEHDVDLGVVYTRPRNIHLDLGSSYFQGWTLAGGGEERINTAASGKWFYETYHARGTKFDAFIAVELEVLDGAAAFKQLPQDLVGHYTLMNVAMTMDEGDKLNVIDLIKRVVRKEDFFVFKLDIDNAPIEAPIIQSILEDDASKGGASGLIDELMFEHRAPSSLLD